MLAPVELNGTPVVIDHAAGVGGGQGVLAGGGTTARGVAADVVIGIGAGIQLVIGIGAAGARAAGAVADGFAAGIVMRGAVAAAQRGRPAGVADRVGGSVGVEAAFGVAVACRRAVGQRKAAGQAGEGVVDVGGVHAGGGIGDRAAFAHGIGRGAGIAAVVADAGGVGNAVVGVTLMIGVREAVGGAGGDREADAAGQRAVLAAAVRIAAAVGNIIGVAARLARRRERAGSEAVAVGSAIALGDAVVGQVALADRGGHAGGGIDIGAAAGEGGGGVILFGGGGLVGAGVGAVAVGIGFLIVIGDRAAVGVDFGEAARVAGTIDHAGVGNAAPFGAAVAIGRRGVTGIGLACDGGSLSGGVGFGKGAGVQLGAGRVEAVVFGDGVGFGPRFLQG